MTFRVQERLDGRSRVLRLFDGDAPMPFGDVLERWWADPAFRHLFRDLLRSAPFEAYCLETPPVVAGSLTRAFECTLVDSPALAGAVADPEPFREQFGDGPVVRFESLGRDALLVAPCPRAAPEAYTHLAAFVRGAPEDQVDALWPAVAEAVRVRLGPRPLWLSTAGLGVSWLHVRVDSRPKYYRTRAYALDQGE